MMTSFTNLPPEIRNEIYKLALTGEFITPHFNNQKQLRKDGDNVRLSLAIGLLRVNRLVAMEAKPIFYAGNLWFLNALSILKHSNTISYEMREPWKSNLNLMHLVILEFDCRNFGVAPRDASLQHVHFPAKAVAATWAKMIDMVRRMPLRLLGARMNSMPEEYFRQVLTNPALMGYYCGRTVPETPNKKLGRITLPNQYVLDQIAEKGASSHRKAMPMRVIVGDAYSDQAKVFHRLGFRCQYCSELVGASRKKKLRFQHHAKKIKSQKAFKLKEHGSNARDTSGRDFCTAIDLGRACSCKKPCWYKRKDRTCDWGL